MSDDAIPQRTPATDDDTFRAAVVDLLGSIAYGELSAFGELASDARDAPTLADRILLSRLAARELAHHERVAARIAELGADPADAMAPFVPALDAYRARTEATTWGERLVKAYVGDGIRTDFYREVAAHVDPDTRVLVEDVLAQAGDRDDALVAGVRAVVDADPAASGRLALWGRRLMGEALSQAQQVIVERDALASMLVGGVDGRGADLAELGRMVTRLGESHAARMARLGLAG